MPTIKGPIVISKDNIGGFIEKARAAGAKINLPFSAKGFKSTKKPVNVEVGESGDKMLDNYLDQNAKTVVKAIKEDSLEKETLGKLLELESIGKNRKTVIETIESELE